MPAVVPPEQLERARRFKQLYNRLEESRDMIAIGGYRPGHDAELDRAMALRPAIESFLRQDMSSAISFADSVSALRELLDE
jgi:flagellum-specific ATP synthase